jgi:cytochrome c
MKSRINAALAGLLFASLHGAPAFAQLDAAKADALMKKAACNACHTVARKGVGPAYRDVAKKHKGDGAAPARLAEKVRKGGSGVWGAIPMPPTGPDRISDADLQQLIAWVLAQ